MSSSGGLPDTAGADASGANAYVLSRAVHNGLDAPQIRIPSPPPQVIGVADGVAKTWFLAADFANERHCFSDSFRKMMQTILSEIGRARKQVNFIVSVWS